MWCRYLYVYNATTIFYCQFVLYKESWDVGQLLQSSTSLGRDSICSDVKMRSLRNCFIQSRMPHFKLTRLWHRIKLNWRITMGDGWQKQRFFCRGFLRKSMRTGRKTFSPKSLSGRSWHAALSRQHSWYADAFTTLFNVLRILNLFLSYSLCRRWTI